MRSRSLVAPIVAAVALAAAGCAADDRDPVVIGPEQVATEPPAYDGTLEPAAAVLAIVPGDATVLEVTDFAQLRLLLGYGDLSGRSPAAERERFWRQALDEAPLLSTGMLREAGVDPGLGFTQDDVVYEAHFDGPSGEGYVLRFREDLDMKAVQRAAAADSGPLAGAVVVPSAQIAALGATREPTESWAADPALVALVGQRAGATYVSRECVDDLAPNDDGVELDELGPFSVAFGGELVTVRLGPQRDDVFERARLGAGPEFARVYADPVADPQSGRIGFTLGDGRAAARLAQQRRLPFAVCGG